MVCERGHFPTPDFNPCNKHWLPLVLLSACNDVFCSWLAETPKLNLDNLFGAKEIRVRAGEPLNIQLGISGTPDPTVEWQKDGVPVGNRVTTQEEHHHHHHHHLSLNLKLPCGDVCCVVSCGSTSFPWLVFFFGALLWGSMIHTHTGRTRTRFRSCSCCSTCWSGNVSTQLVLYCWQWWQQETRNKWSCEATTKT